jgi:hypothetical protein
MRYTETIRIQTSSTQPIAEFMAMNQLVRQQAAENGQTHLDWLAGQFLPDAGLEEGFGDWIARQAGAILETALLCDTMSGASHVARKISGVVLSWEDRDWLVRTLGRHPVVLGIWRSMLPEAIAA